MHICIVGTGAAGWIAANYLKNLDIVDKVTIVGSSRIPPIGVGESNTMAFNAFFQDMIDRGEFTMSEFLEGTDAAIKYGVMYKGWSPKNFLHHFKNWSNFGSSTSKYPLEFYGRLLANKDESTHIHELMAKELFEEVQRNNVLLGQDEYRASFHFDAAKFIGFFSKNAIKNKKVFYIDALISGGKILEDEVKFIKSDLDQRIEADFYIFATGDYKINEEFLGIKYKDMSNILLTNKAVVYPLKYENKRNQFHPYTVAKTMKNGWRWITPTWSRIGTGYTFSTNHVSEEEAIKEFVQDIGDETISPHVVDFSPKHNENPIHKNWCTVGMASGFLEPLDAPGLAMTISSLMNQVTDYLYFIKDNKEEEKISVELEKLNDFLSREFKFWATFILCQYKTSWRNDTEFWKDHKSVQWEFYEETIKNIDIPNSSLEYMMLHQTIASKDIRWNTSLKSKPYKLDSINYTPMHHLDYIEYIKNNKI